MAYASRARVLLYNASPLNNPENNQTKWQRAADAAQDVIEMPQYSLVPMSDYKRLFLGAPSTPVNEIIWRDTSDNSNINNPHSVALVNYPNANIKHFLYNDRYHPPAHK